MPDEFDETDDAALVEAALDRKLGFRRAKAVSELANRALTSRKLMSDALQAISGDRQSEFHNSAPIGWYGADHVFLSGNTAAIAALLAEMDSWEPNEQTDLIRHWAGRRGLAELAHVISQTYGWSPKFSIRDTLGR